LLTNFQLDLGGQVAYFIGTLFLKLSILLFYLRLNPDLTFRRISYSIGAFDVFYIVLSIGIAVLGCSPVTGGWNVTIKSTCVNKKAYCEQLSGVPSLLNVTIQISA